MTRRGCAGAFEHRRHAPRMSTCLVYYGTSEGHTRTIAARVAERLEARGIDVELAESPADVDPAEYDAVIIGDSIHIGRHHRRVLKFIRAHRAALDARPTAFFSVCLAVNSKNEADRKRAHAFVDDMIARTGWKPTRTTSFAGALKYTQYGLLTRFVMKRIAAAEGGSTDTTRDHDYTDWDAVAAFADAFAELLADASAASAAARGA
jgi:menaquinone-dependent protoporphyrinogen oxidase